MWLFFLIRTARLVVALVATQMCIQDSQINENGMRKDCYFVFNHYY